MDSVQSVQRAMPTHDDRDCLHCHCVHLLLRFAGHGVQRDFGIVATQSGLGTRSPVWDSFVDESTDDREVKIRLRGRFKALKVCEGGSDRQPVLKNG